MYITTAGDQCNEFHKRMLNSVYGRYPERDSLWVQEVFTEAVKNGTIKTRLTESSWYTREEIEKILSQPVFDMQKTIQQVYDAHVKGENSMDNIMNDIAFGKPAYLVTDSGKTPIRIDEWTTSYGEAPRFEGHMLADTILTGKVVRSGPRPWGKLPNIKTVHFSGPVTAVIWEDGTKSIVRCNNDTHDPEKGLAMAIAKKALGTNKTGSNYYDIFKQWLPKPEVEEE